MNNQELLQKVQTVFLAKIEQKNSWGKHEVVTAWKDALLDVLFQLSTEVPRP